ncbi:MAG: ATP-binding protein [Dehalococcoidia bacterium]
MPASFLTPVALDRDAFMRQLIASLGHLNEGILGSEVAGGYITNVGLSMGAAMEAEYKRFWGIDRPFTVDEYAHVIVDLKQKIQGNFSLIGSGEDYVEVETTSCPFEDFVKQSPSLCFMTSSVFGGIAARNFGYAKVVLHKRIALGDPGCHVTVHLKPTDAAKAAVGREYFPEADLASPDIAEQLHLMERLKELRGHLERSTIQWDALVDASPGAILVVDTDGHIAVANSAWRELAGVEGAELIGGRAVEIAVDDEADGVQDALKRVLSGERLATEVRVKHRVAAGATTMMSGGPLRSDSGQIYGAILLFHDISERVEVERMKEEFLHASSHELRTPITTIKGLTQYLLKAIERDQLEPADLADRLRRIQHEADRLVMLGGDLADAIGMRGSGKMRLKREVSDLTALVREAIAEERSSTSPPRYEVDAPSTPMTASIDPQRITQILDNMLSNAEKYSPDGGTIRVQLQESHDAVEVQVSDEGIGIPADQLEEIFQPFVRGTNAASLNFPGTGLGLYIARAIAEAHGGVLLVESKERGGSTFTLRLPREA